VKGIMKNTIELIKPWQGGIIGFFLGFGFFLILSGFFSNIRFEFIIILGLIMGCFMGVYTVTYMRRFRNLTITIPFTNKEEFMKKLNIYLFQMKFKLESNKENFLVYQQGWSSRRIAVTFSEKDATIVGSKFFVEKLHKSFT
jgi:hypothetical protein